MDADRTGVSLGVPLGQVRLYILQVATYNIQIANWESQEAHSPAFERRGLRWLGIVDRLQWQLIIQLSLRSGAIKIKTIFINPTFEHLEALKFTFIDLSCSFFYFHVYFGFILFIYKSVILTWEIVEFWLCWQMCSWNIYLDTLYI